MATVIAVDVVASLLALAVLSADRGNADGVQVARIAYGTFVIAQIATALSLAAWSLRTVDNVTSLGGEGSRVLAGLGWLIPFAHLLLPFIELKSAARSIGAEHPAIDRWHGAFVAAFIAALMPFAASTEIALVGTAASIVLLAVACGAARTAMEHLDDAIYDRAVAAQSASGERDVQGAVHDRTQI